VSEFQISASLKADGAASQEKQQQPRAEIHIRKCRYGLMAFFPHDFYLGGALERYGEYAEDESRVLQGYVKPGDIVVEVGANIGCHTLALAQCVTNAGRVFAFEPQRIIHQMLCGNLAINGIWNVIAERMALGAEAGIAYVPPIDYAAPGNFGAVSLAKDVGEPVQVQTLDGCNFVRCDLIKIDVEGMEGDVLKGAAQTIKRLRPVLYVENDREEKKAALIAQLRLMGYAIYWHLPALFNPQNFNKNEINDYGSTVSINMLCLPEEKKMPCDLPRVELLSETLH
jgi:FkbM family methyltransferase